jgi:hypothetical protein
MYHLAQNMVKRWIVVTTVKGVLFGSEHGQAVDYCEHSNRCLCGSEHGQAVDCGEHSNRCII